MWKRSVLSLAAVGAFGLLLTLSALPANTSTQAHDQQSLSGSRSTSAHESLDRLPEGRAINPHAGHAREDYSDRTIEAGSASKSRSAAFRPAALSGAATLGDDFVVNDDTLGRDNELLFPALACNGAGVSVAAWSDVRNAHRDVYAQRLSASGAPIGSNIRVTDAYKGAAQRPAVTVFPSGRFVVVWCEDLGLGVDTIHAQWFDAGGTPRSGNVTVAPAPGGISAYGAPVSVACGVLGGVAIVWSAGGGSRNHIYARLYDSLGVPVSEPFKVNEDASGTDHWSPSVAMDGAGNFMVTWMDERDGFVNKRVYGRMFANGGLPVTGDFAVHENTSSSQWYPAGAASHDGRFVVSWSEAGTLLGKYFDQFGGALGNAVPIGTGVGGYGYDHLRSGVSMDSVGRSVFYWSSWSGSYVRSCDSQGNPSGDAVVLDPGPFWLDEPRGALANNGELVLAWRCSEMLTSYCFGRSIVAGRFAIDGNQLVDYMRVTDDHAVAAQYRPAIGARNGSGAIVAWSDHRVEDGECTGPQVYAQLFDNAGSRTGANLLVGEGPVGFGSLDYYNLAATLDARGTSIICWSRNNTVLDHPQDVSMRRFDAAGVALGPSTVVNEHSGSYRTYPAVAVSDSGFAVMCWIESDGEIYGQLMDGDGVLLGGNFLVDDVHGYSSPPSVAVAPDKRFVITWKSGPEAQMRVFDEFAVPVAPHRVVNESPDNASAPTVALDNGGQFMIVWADARSGDLHAYAQRFDVDGSPLGANQRMSDDNAVGVADVKVAAADRNGYVIVWTDLRDGRPAVYRQVCDLWGNLCGQNERISAESDFEQLYPNVAIADSVVYCTWQDNGQARHWDIVARAFVDNCLQGRRVDIDVLPSNCPNTISIGTTIDVQTLRPSPASVGSQAISVAVLGTGICDVHDIDPASLTLAGVAASGYRYTDVSRPIGQRESGDCECAVLPGDGLLDLVLSFRQDLLVAALTPYVEGETRTLTLEGCMKDGIALSGVDCVTITSQPMRVTPLAAEESDRPIGLLECHPNPFNASTVISFALARPTQVRLDICNVLGQRVTTLVTETLSAGLHQYEWHASGSASGVYFARLISDVDVDIQKVVLVK